MNCLQAYDKDDGNLADDEDNNNDDGDDAVCLQADNKLAAARLMRDIAELRQRVAQVEARLANELKVDIFIKSLENSQTI